MITSCLMGQDIPSATPVEILTGMTPHEKMFLIRKHTFIDNAMDALVSIDDEEIQFNQAMPDFFPLFFDPDTIGVPEQFYEEQAEETIRNYMDIPPTVSLNGVLHAIADAIKSSKRNAVLANPPIPTMDEIAVLRVVWKQDLATSSDVYAALDSTTLAKFTSEDIQKLLKNMTDRGFLDRKQISPAREFTFFGFAKIEMSTKNRRNKLYIYWPVISRERLITMLDTRRYFALASMKIQENQRAITTQKSLEQKLLQVIR